ncbi:heterokaryon incompatibility protein-domain-containing protein [Paraphoma chrysanthemicola]|uniref:Heterokaryon incompatibility protein-domain-containing protein n=1 Tax=Paraphoma chrysanthemicola TaxID=798071 RepID=A0A8K0QZK8_9PLEO|nr:heterokaryon incompatibility protein-domain-containing protein [Paraphoma chrysanthemicola]
MDEASHNSHDPIYRHLDAYRGSFRLLELCPGKFEDGIECELLVVDWHDHPHYESLSYTWGEPPSTRTMTLVGHTMLVGENLHSALRHLRYPDRARVLWIDALCINQSDEEEKTRQVGMMRRIYESCSECLIWLGQISMESDNQGSYTVKDAETAFEIIRLFAAAEPDGDLPANLRSSNARKGACNAIEGMMFWGNTWWRRIWTVQEAVIPTRKIITWQTLSISWDVCTQAAENMLNPSMRHYQLIDALSPEFSWSALNGFISPMLSLEFTREEALQTPLWTLQRWRHREATDPRDKVYALMGLFQDAHFPSITCDYTLSTVAVFKRLTLDLLLLERTLLPLVGLRGEPHATAGLPTWVLDMVRPPRPVNSGCKFWEHMDRFHQFHADNNMDLEMETLDDHSILSLRGLPVDVVLLVDEGIAVDERIILPDEDFIRVVKRRERISQNHFETSCHNTAISDSWEHAFWRTMLGDVITENELVKRRALGSDQELFRAFIDNSEANEVTESVRSMILNQAFFITQKGHIGIGPPNTKEGDTVWVLAGGRVPFVLRPTGNKLSQRQVAGEYMFVGDAFVQGVMDGEFIRNRQDELQRVLLD